MSKYWGHLQEMLSAWHSSVQLANPCFPCLKDSQIAAFQFLSVIAGVFAVGCNQAGLPGCLPGPGAASSSCCQRTQMPVGDKWQGGGSLWPLARLSAALLPLLGFPPDIVDVLCPQELNPQWPALVFSVSPEYFCSPEFQRNWERAFFDFSLTWDPAL